MGVAASAHSIKGSQEHPCLYTFEGSPYQQLGKASGKNETGEKGSQQLPPLSTAAHQAALCSYLLRALLAQLLDVLVQLVPSRQQLPVSMSSTRDTPEALR